MYKNWKLIKNREKALANSLTPLRAVHLFRRIISDCVYPLLKEIRLSLEASDPENQKTKFPAGAIAIAWIIITLSYKLPDPCWLICLFNFIPLLGVQARVNELNRFVYGTSFPAIRSILNRSAINWLELFSAQAW